METVQNLIQQQVESIRPQQNNADRIIERQKNAASVKRQELKKLTDRLRAQAENKTHPDGKPISNNELIIDYYCNLWQLDHLELKTYDEWQAQGYQVKAGEKAISLWGQKAIWYKGQLKDENGNPIPNTGEPIEYCQMRQVFDITQTYHVENCK